MKTITILEAILTCGFHSLKSRYFHENVYTGGGVSEHGER